MHTIFYQSFAHAVQLEVLGKEAQALLGANDGARKLQAEFHNSRRFAEMSTFRAFRVAVANTAPPIAKKFVSLARHAVAL